MLKGEIALRAEQEAERRKVLAEQAAYAAAESAWATDEATYDLKDGFLEQAHDISGTHPLNGGC